MGARSTMPSSAKPSRRSAWAHRILIGSSGSRLARPEQCRASDKTGSRSRAPLLDQALIETSPSASARTCTYTSASILLSVTNCAGTRGAAARQNTPARAAARTAFFDMMPGFLPIRASLTRFQPKLKALSFPEHSPYRICVGFVFDAQLDIQIVRLCHPAHTRHRIHPRCTGIPNSPQEAREFWAVAGEFASSAAFSKNWSKLTTFMRQTCLYLKYGR